jgi:hypothetical protein
LRLIIVGAALFLVGFLLRRVVNWGEVPESLRSFRNRPGEWVSLVLGPALVVGGIVSLLA